MKTDDFRYELPPEAIAQQPIEPRDSARLLDTRDMTDHVFRDLASVLRAGDLLVVNTSRVRAARLRGKKVPTGGAVELLVLTSVGESRWSAMVRPARRLRPGTVMDFGTLRGVVEEGPTEGRVIVELTSETATTEEAIAVEGELPLPPYIEADLSDPERYQTIYSDRVGSAAAPTAGLHFTPDLLESLIESGIGIASLDLEVSSDTFRPIAAADIEDHRMHSERYVLPEDAAAQIARVREEGGRIVAVGTTVVRVLETRAAGDGRVFPGSGETDLFIQPGHRFEMVDGLVTNFHLPGSSLVVLVAAFMGQRWRSVYEEALARGYRFLSFGDAMYAEARR